MEVAVDEDSISDGFKRCGQETLSGQHVTACDETGRAKPLPERLRICQNLSLPALHRHHHHRLSHLLRPCALSTLLRSSPHLPSLAVRLAAVIFSATVSSNSTLLR